MDRPFNELHGNSTESKFGKLINKQLIVNHPRISDKNIKQVNV